MVILHDIIAYLAQSVNLRSSEVSVKKHSFPMQFIPILPQNAQNQTDGFFLSQFLLLGKNQLMPQNS
jgi:hypothetical protein